MEQTKPSVNLLESLIPITILMVLLALNVRFFGDDSLGGSSQLSLLIAAGIAIIIGVRKNFSWKELEGGIVKGIASVMPSILILLMIGALAGSWLVSGVIPALIIYGLKILNPVIFLFAACFISALVSLSTGSSWATIATIGVALVGVGKVLGWSEGIVAGAIISGAYFGDKMSPLSDTTNLAPAMAGTDLFTHIRYMAFTTGPSIVITLIIFGIMGFFKSGEIPSETISSITKVIEAEFYISPILFVVPVVVIYMIVKKTPALPAMGIGTFLGVIFAGIFQPELVHKISGIQGGWQSMYVGLSQSVFGDINISTSNPLVNELLSTSGMAGMLSTVWLILCALTFGGVLEVTGMLGCIGRNIVRLANSTGALVASTAGTCVFFNLTASDQYLAIVVPGRIFAKAYKNAGLKPEVLSRTLEDSGTVTSVLVPWNTCGATQAIVLGVPTLAYAPYAFFNIISPFMTIAFAYLNIKIRREEEKKIDDETIN